MCRPPLGDLVSIALSHVGVTEKRVTDWLGRPCGCAERREMMNQLDAWARRVTRGATDNALEYLEGILCVQ